MIVGRVVLGGTAIWTYNHQFKRFWEEIGPPVARPRTCTGRRPAQRSSRVAAESWQCAPCRRRIRMSARAADRSRPAVQDWGGYFVTV